MVIDPALARAIGFFNIYHVMWESIEREKILMHCENTIYHDDFSKYMKVEGAASEDALIISSIWELKNCYQKKERNTYMNYLRSGIQSI